MFILIFVLETHTTTSISSERSKIRKKNLYQEGLILLNTLMANPPVMRRLDDEAPVLRKPWLPDRTTHHHCLAPVLAGDVCGTALLEQTYVAPSKS